METVELQQLVLLNVANQVTRKATPTNVGILLGSHTDSVVNIAASFEFLVDDNTIDTDYLFTRYGQFNTVLNYEVIGFYVAGTSIELKSSLQLQLVDFFKNMDVDYFNLMLVFDSDNLLQFKAYHNNTQVKTIVLSNESERISSITALNHPTITEDSKDQPISIQDHQMSLLNATSQLEEKFTTIISWLNDPNYTNIKHKIEINNKIGFLALKLQPYNGIKQDQFLQLNSSQLSLLTDQLAALERLKSEIKKNIVR